MKSTRQYISPEQEQIDKAICQLARRCNLVSSIEPINAMDECTKFLDLKGQYNPQFVYKKLDTAKIQQTVNVLLGLQRDFTANDPITQFQARKVQELIEKYSLMLAYQKQDFESIYKYNIRLFETIPWDEEIPVPKHVPQISCTEYLQTNAYDDIDTLDAEQAQDLIHIKCQQLGIQNYQIILKHIGSGSMTIQCEDVIKINLNTKKVFNKTQFAATLCHEIDGHIMRYRNGLDSGIHLFAEGTGYYKATEEGVASYRKASILGIEYTYSHLSTMRNKCRYGLDHDWIQLCSRIQETRKSSLEKAFWMALRVKKGIQDTSIIHPGTIYQFDRVYMEGRSIVDTYLAAQGSIESLMIGKICVDDLQILA